MIALHSHVLWCHLGRLCLPFIASMCGCLQLCHLADRFDVPAALAEIAKLLAALPESQFPCEVSLVTVALHAVQCLLSCLLLATHFNSIGKETKQPSWQLGCFLLGMLIL